jgi:signal transduction histidine kinase
MLAFSCRQDLNREAVDVPKLVLGTSELLQRFLGPSISIETRFPLALSKVYSNANQLESALLNLAVNARDAMPEGGPIIIAAREESIPPRHKTALSAGSYV